MLVAVGRTAHHAQHSEPAGAGEPRDQRGREGQEDDVQPRGVVPGLGGLALRHPRAATAAIRSLAALITASGVKPNSAASVLSGADAPNVRMPITAPAMPTYQSQPSGEACSTATRAVTDGISTSSRYSAGCRSNSSQQGMLTPRARTRATRG